MSKINFPSNFIIDLYIVYSYFTLAITWLITPLLIYTILTQSKNLKAFKWLILNHTLWCLAFETLIASIKPLVFTPSYAGYPLGIIRENGSFLKTAIATLMGFLFGINSVIYLCISMGFRYLLVFPTAITKLCNLKVFLIVGITATTMLFLAICGIISFALSVDQATVKQWAIEFDPFFAQINEPAFVFWPTKFMYPFAVVIFSALILVHIGGILLSAHFIYKIKSMPSTSTLTRINRSLIISSILQMAITKLFLTLPMAIIFGNIVFKVENSATSTTIAWAAVCTHAFAEFCVILLYVSPYRKFLKFLLSKIFWCCYKLKVDNSSVPVSFNSSSVRDLRTMRNT